MKHGDLVKRNGDSHKSLSMYDLTWIQSTTMTLATKRDFNRLWIWLCTEMVCRQTGGSSYGATILVLFSIDGSFSSVNYVSLPKTLQLLKGKLMLIVQSLWMY